MSYLKETEVDIIIVELTCKNCNIPFKLDMKSTVEDRSEGDEISIFKYVCNNCGNKAEAKELYPKTKMIPKGIK